MNKNYKGQLVCQHLGKISHELIEGYAKIICEYVREQYRITFEYIVGFSNCCLIIQKT